jgi:hypothetical protein
VSALAGVCLSLGRVVALVGGLALLAAYPMPWFGVTVGGQGVLLSGQFLGRFLAGTNDLSRVLPGAAGGPAEVRQLLALVYLFPVSGAVAALLAAGTALLGRRAPWNRVLLLAGAVPLVALGVGVSRLPPNASPEIGLWVIGIGGAAVVVGAALDGLSGGPRPAAAPAR